LEIGACDFARAEGWGRGYCGDRVGSWELEFSEETYHALHGANEHTVQNLARFITVADIFEGFGAVLAADIKEDFLATTVKEKID
jgi:hypothetical protein